MVLQINATSLLVDDQKRALEFYTKVLGFVKKREIPLGDDLSWLSVVSADDVDKDRAVELSLEPVKFPPAQTYQKALYDAAIPATAFEVENVREEYDRLSKGHKVSFRGGDDPIVDAGETFLAILDDTCGNWIQIYEMKKKEEDAPAEK